MGIRTARLYPDLSLSGLQILEWASAQDKMLPKAAVSSQKRPADGVLLAYGLVLRKSGLFKLASKAWDFAQKANLGRFYDADAQKLSFLALQASRCVHHADYDPHHSVLEESSVNLIDAVYRTMDIPNFQEPLDLFYYYRLQLIDFPNLPKHACVLHVDFQKRSLLEWSAPCPCRSCLPYGECCGLYL